MKLVVYSKNKRTGELSEYTSFDLSYVKSITPVTQTSESKKLLGTGVKITCQDTEDIFMGDSFYDIHLIFE